MGMEIDLRELSPEELSTLERWTARYKQHRSLLHGGFIFQRLQTDDPAIYAHAVISEDREHFLLFAFFTDTTLNSVQGPLRVTGLDRSRSYEVSLWDKPDTPAEDDRETLQALNSITKLNVATMPPALFRSFNNRSGLKSESVAFCASPGK
jgi:alpha-galactosidase